ncbi:hypothetical protein EMPG_12643 [Blastomyces silverae]|uniref:Arrestin-like N-terminal domain-containing protein n=1 Tax=Blastomyces silverae TaxID=2060906 RepID=A0A0H1BLZ1_9EURO|nr:hypothetical protein EMPG_12643 [Blastomyces silverae]
MPALRIALDSAPGVWSPGCIIQGRVVLDSSEDEAISAITIRFSGKEKTEKKSGENKFHGEVRFFSYVQQLFRGNYTFSASKNLEWPFQFVFPDKHHVGSTTRDNFFRGPNDDALPPTLHYETPFMALLYTADCRIQYKLSAELERPSTFSLKSGRLSAERRLPFIPHRSEQSPAVTLLATPFPWKVYSKRILPEFENYAPTMKEKVATVFTSRTKLPSSAFKIYTRLPSKTIMGQSIPIMLSATHLPDDSTTNVVPIIRLRSFRLAIEFRTAFCAYSTFGRRTNEERADQITLVDRPNLDIPLDPEPCNVGQLLNTICPASLAPSFASNIVRRKYGLQLKIIVECAGCTKTIYSLRPAFEVLSSSYLQLPPGPPPPPPPFLLSEVEAAAERDGAELPAYRP